MKTINQQSTEGKNMKNTNFIWGWNNYPLQPDPLMTRSRAAHLLRCWRRLLRKRANYMPLRSLVRIAPHQYRVTDQYGESSIIGLV